MYKLAENGVIRLSDNAFIPNDPANTDWQEYQEWLKEGNEPLPMYTPNELRQKLKNDMLFLRNMRINNVVKIEYEYDDLADVYVYTNDPELSNEANQIINWYLKYDDLIWNWIDNELPNIPDDELENIDVNQIEDNLYQQSLQ